MPTIHRVLQLTTQNPGARIARARRRYTGRMVRGPEESRSHRSLDAQRTEYVGSYALEWELNDRCAWCLDRLDDDGGDEHFDIFVRYGEVDRPTLKADERTSASPSFDTLDDPASPFSSDESLRFVRVGGRRIHFHIREPRTSEGVRRPGARFALCGPECLAACEAAFRSDPEFEDLERWVIGPCEVWPYDADWSEGDILEEGPVPDARRRRHLIDALCRIVREQCALCRSPIDRHGAVARYVDLPRDLTYRSAGRVVMVPLGPLRVLGLRSRAAMAADLRGTDVKFLLCQDCERDLLDLVEEWDLLRVVH
jgi:hypothetical protein